VVLCARQKVPAAHCEVLEAPSAPLFAVRHEPAEQAVHAAALPTEKKKAGHWGTVDKAAVPHVAPVGHAAPVPAGQKEPAGHAITSDATAVAVAAPVVGQ
jgi:hypothetical protein